MVVMILAFFVREAGNYDFRLKTVIFWLVGMESRRSHTKTPSERTLTGFFSVCVPPMYHRRTTDVTIGVTNWSHNRSHNPESQPGVTISDQRQNRMSNMSAFSPNSRKSTCGRSSCRACASAPSAEMRHRRRDSRNTITDYQ